MTQKVKADAPLLAVDFNDAFDVVRKLARLASCAGPFSEVKAYLSFCFYFATVHSICPRAVTAMLA